MPSRSQILTAFFHFPFRRRLSADAAESEHLQQQSAQHDESEGLADQHFADELLAHDAAAHRRERQQPEQRGRGIRERQYLGDWLAAAGELDGGRRAPESLAACERVRNEQRRRVHLAHPAELGQFEEDGLPDGLLVAVPAAAAAVAPPAAPPAAAARVQPGAGRAALPPVSADAPAEPVALLAALRQLRPAVVPLDPPVGQLKRAAAGGGRRKYG